MSDLSGGRGWAARAALALTARCHENGIRYHTKWVGSAFAGEARGRFVKSLRLSLQRSPIVTPLSRPGDNRQYYEENAECVPRKAPGSGRYLRELLSWRTSGEPLQAL